MLEKFAAECTVGVSVVVPKVEGRGVVEVARSEQGFVVDGIGYAVSVDTHIGFVGSAVGLGEAMWVAPDSGRVEDKTPDRSLEKAAFVVHAEHRKETAEDYHKNYSPLGT